MSQYKIEVKEFHDFEKTYPEATRLVGYVNGEEVITVNNHLDFGGAILVGNPYQRPLPNVTFFDQHYSLVKAYVLRAKQSGDRGGYYKIHAERAICLTPVTFQNLLDYLEDNAERLLLGEVAQNERFFERVADLKQNSPHIS